MFYNYIICVYNINMLQTNKYYVKIKDFLDHCLEWYVIYIRIKIPSNEDVLVAFNAKTLRDNNNYKKLFKLNNPEIFVEKSNIINSYRIFTTLADLSGEIQVLYKLYSNDTKLFRENILALID